MISRNAYDWERSDFVSGVWTRNWFQCRFIQYNKILSVFCIMRKCCIFFLFISVEMAICECKRDRISFAECLIHSSAAINNETIRFCFYFYFLYFSCRTLVTLFRAACQSEGQNHNRYNIERSWRMHTKKNKKISDQIRNYTSLRVNEIQSKVSFILFRIFKIIIRKRKN